MRNLALGCIVIPVLLLIIGGLLFGGGGGTTDSPTDSSNQQSGDPAAGDESESQEAQNAQDSGDGGMQTAVISVGGTGGVPFTGSVGNIDNTRSVDGVTPAEFEVEFSGDEMDFDSVYVDFYKEMDANAEYPPGTISAEIAVDGEVVQETSSSAEDGYLSLSWSPYD